MPRLTKARSLRSFGVAGVLDISAEVYYNSFFNTKHLGRITDLLIARFQDGGMDELRFRLVLVLSVFETLQNSNPKEDSEDLKVNSNLSFDSPMVLECGLDHEKIAIAISLDMPETWSWNLGGLVERINAKQPGNDFERLLLQSLFYADQVVLRVKPSIQKMEVVVVVALPAFKVDLSDDIPFQLIHLDEVKTERPPPPSKYVNLADINYSELLEEELTDGASEDLSAGDSDGEEEDEDEEEGSTSGRKEKSKEKKRGKTKSRGKARRPSPTGEFVVGGSAEVIGERILVKGEQFADDDDTLQVVRGGRGAPKKKKKGFVNRTFGNTKKRFQKLFGLFKSDVTPEEEENLEDIDGPEIDSVEEEIAPEQIHVPASKGQAPESDKFLVRGEKQEQVSTVYRFSENDEVIDSETIVVKGQAAPGGPEGDLVKLFEAEIDKDAKKEAKKEEVQEALEKTVDTEGVESTENKPTKAQQDSSDPSESNKAISEDVTEPVEEDSTEVETDIQEEGGTSKGRIDLEIEQMRKRSKDPAMSKWLANLTGVLVKEKKKVADANRALTASLRAREEELESQISQLKATIKQKDNKATELENHVIQYKESLAEMAKKSEQLKREIPESTGDKDLLEKMNQLQKAMAAAKAENRKLLNEMSEINQEKAALAAAVKAPAAGGMSFAMQEKHDTLIRQTEEYRRQIKQLMENLNQVSKDKGGARGENIELKKRMDLATKVIQQFKKDNDDMKKRIEGLTQAEAALKFEVLKLQAETRRYRGHVKPVVAAKKPEDGGSGSSAA